MSRILDLLGYMKSRKDGLALVKSVDGEWSVKKGYKTMYIGSKDKCMCYMSQW